MLLLSSPALGRAEHGFKVLNYLPNTPCSEYIFHASCREEGHEVEIRVTYEPGDSDRIVEEALAAKNVDAIVAAGGDGSVNEVWICHRGFALECVWRTLQERHAGKRSNHSHKEIVHMPSFIQVSLRI